MFDRYSTSYRVMIFNHPVLAECECSIFTTSSWIIAIFSRKIRSPPPASPERYRSYYTHTHAAPPSPRLFPLSHCSLSNDFNFLPNSFPEWAHTCNMSKLDIPQGNMSHISRLIFKFSNNK